jgi:thermitase
MRKTFVIYLSFALVGLALLPKTGAGQKDVSTDSRSDAASVPGEMLVQFKAGAGNLDKARALARINGVEMETVMSEERRNDGQGTLVLVKYQPDFTKAAAMSNLRQDENVMWAEPNFMYTHLEVSNDPAYTQGLLYGMYGPSTSPANQFGSNAAAAWAVGATGSAGVYVAVIDEGIECAHPDLSGQCWNNPYEIPGDRIDNDGNGYVDDINGYDFANNDNTVYDGNQSSNNRVDNHGTHVSGTIGAKGSNGIGVAGVNWNITLIPTKFLGANGGTTANAIRAVDYVTDLKLRHGLNIVATNNSWGGGGFSQALRDAIERANQAGILFVAAAGNAGSNNDTTPNYPSNYTNTNVIAVAAITSTGGLASFSNFGANTVDIGAPGSGIISTTAFNTYSNYSGTSMATPHVTGACALYASVHPGASAAQIKNAILSSAVPTSSLTGRTVTGGRLDVFRALSQ